ncbi:MAG: MBL fold metallo-hydrolase, partial [Magnetococcales bacterium]|nr:MBL fold metallo-hydrolase [Magnetococcales bacterium]
DTHYTRPGFAACYFIWQEGEGAFIETGPAPSVGRLLTFLEQQAIPVEAVRWVIVTHGHLDHAGGAGLLLQKLPNATLVAHPKAMKHLVDPSRLVASSREVYGDEVFDRLFSPVEAVDASRTLEAGNGTVVSLGQRALTMLETPGHALHHNCIWDETSRGVFTGDAFGLSYREFDTAGGIFLFPSTTPTQFDPKASHITIDRIAALQPKWIYLTHFGTIAFNRSLADDLHRQIDRICAVARGSMKAGAERRNRIVTGMEKAFFSRLSRIGTLLTQEEMHKLLASDLELNAMGLECWLDRPAR